MHVLALSEHEKSLLVLIELGGGRKQINDKINYSVGYENVASVGDFVDQSSPLMKVHTSSQDDYQQVQEKIKNCFTISEKKQEKLDTIHEVID